MPPAASTYPLLPDPPPLEHYCLESPWQIIVLLTLSGLIFLYQANQKPNRRFLAASVACIAVALLLFLLSSAITTTRETLRKQNDAFIGATIPLSTDTIRPFLTSDCEFYQDPAATPRPAIDAIDAFVKGKQAEIVLSNHLLRQDIAVESPNAAKSQIWLKTYLKPSVMGDWPPVTTRWEFHWVLQDGRWKIKSIRLIERPE